MTVSLVSSNPASGATGVANNATVSFVLQSSSAPPASGITVYLDGLLAISAGAFQSGFAGTFGTSGNQLTVTISTHPNFGHTSVSCVITSSGGGPTAELGLAVLGFLELGFAGSSPSYLSFSFSAVVNTISSLVAKSWCDGKRIDLLWTNPSGITGVKIRRSQFSYCRFIDDPGTDIYSGSPISGYVDGPGPVPSTYPVGTVQSTTALDEGTFYYYTIFVSYDPGMTQWIWSASGQVEGLSIKDYYSRYGDYVYNWLPTAQRRRDADPARGTDQYQLKDYCRVLQCQVNLFRGWLEGLLLLRDPDLMPAGRLGDANNQTGILQALSWDLGMPPEKAFDAGVLRRIAMGLIPVYQQKGTCLGLVSLTKLFTTWNSRCAEAIMPDCGADRLVMTWDGTSKINTVVVAANANNPTLSVGSVTLNTATIFMADGVTADSLPATSAGTSTVAFVIDAMGTYACVQSVASVSGSTQQLTFTDTAAQLRSNIQGSGTGAANQFTISSVSTGSYPWQFPTSNGSSAPQWGVNAWAGYHLKDHTGAVFPITASAGSAAASGPGTDILTVTGTPATGTYTLALSFDGSGNPLFGATLYTGEFSLTLNSRVDVRLMDEAPVGPSGETLDSPWSLLTGLGSIQAVGYAPTPADVIIWAQNVHTDKGESTGVTTSTLSDTSKSWIANQFVGYYVLPNWNQTKVFKILSNTSSQLLVDLSGGGGNITSLSQAGAHYVILTEKNALMYSRLVALLPSFTPAESRGLVKFETH